MEIKKVNLTKGNLLKIKDIDDLFYKNAIPGIDWYLERYNNNHTAFFLLDESENICGYMVAVPVKKELYNTIINGVITNDLYINPQMYVKESKYYYIVSSVILEEYRGKGYGSKLMEKLLQEINDKTYCALTISTDGYNLAKKYMNIKLKINENIFIFEKKPSKESAD